MSWSCTRCGSQAEDTAARCPRCMAMPGASRDDKLFAKWSNAPVDLAAYGARDLSMEAHLGALGIWHRVIGVVMVLAAASLLTVGQRWFDTFRELGPLNELLHGLVVFLGLFFLVVGVGWFVLGHFLARFYNGARVLVGVLAALGLAGAVLQAASVLGAAHGTGGRALTAFAALVPSLGWNGGQLWVVLSTRAATVCTARYRHTVSSLPDLSTPTFRSPFFFVPLALVTCVALFVCGTALIH